MAAHVADALEDARVHELQAIRARVSGDNARIKVDQMRVVVTAALGGIDAVGIVTGGTGNSLVQMKSVRGEALVTQDAVAAVAGIAQGVGEFTFRGKVRGFVVMFEQRPIDRAMRSAGGGPFLGTVAVGAMNDAGHRHAGLQAGDILTDSGAHHRVEGVSRGVELQTCIRLRHHPGDV